VPVSDVERAVGFYRDVLGLRHVATYGDLAFFDLAGVRLLLERNESSDRSGAHVLYVAVDDIDAAHTALVDRGVTFVQDPHLVFADQGGTFGPAGEEEWMAFFHDSEGNLLALATRR
jgi:methylmalonyl-CoA/ethylmalonyl-CoA epimerase